MNPGVLYFVVGKRGEQKYLSMLKTSAKSLKTHMPWLKTALFTDLEIKELEYFDDIISTGHCEQGGLWRYKWEECLMKSPYEPTLHLDADTYICDDFSEVFTLLDRFDLAIPLSPHYGMREWHGVPGCFPELAAGFILWKKNRKTDWLFNRTLELLKMKLTKRADEPYFAKALYESKVRYAIIPWEYTCVYTHPGYLYGKVKIMHGKRTDDIVKDAEIFNEDVGKRIYTGEELIRLDVRSRSSKIKEIIKYRR